MEVLWFGYMEEVVCNGDDLILNPLFNFEPMEGHRENIGLLVELACSSIRHRPSLQPSQNQDSLIGFEPRWIVKE